MKSKKIKRVFITALAALCAMSSMTAITASAKTEKYVHTVAVATGKGENATTWMYMKKKGTCSDLFGSYPTIFDKKSSATVESRLTHSNGITKTARHRYKLMKNSPAQKSVNYGTLSRTGNWMLEYRYYSGGGFKSTVTTMKKY